MGSMSFLILDMTAGHLARMYHNGFPPLIARFWRCHILFINCFRSLSLGLEAVC